MINIIKESYLFLILFLIIILKDFIYGFIPNPITYTNIECSYLKDEYNKLLLYNEIEFIYDYKPINTFIIYKDMYDYMNEITIKGGSDYGFNKNAVVFDNTLIGYIDKVSKNSSRVKLITNIDTELSVAINNEFGVLLYENNMLKVKNISNYSDIKIGDMIFTSGLGNIKEKIYIGLVKEINYINGNIEKEIIVAYDIDIKDLSYVTVLGE